MSHNRISHTRTLGMDTEGLALNPEVYAKKTESDQKGYAAAYKEGLKRPLFSKETILGYFNPSDIAGDKALDPNITGFETKTKEVRHQKTRVGNILKAIPKEFFRALRKIEDIRLPVSMDIGDLTIKLHVGDIKAAEGLAELAVGLSSTQLAFVKLSTGSLMVRPAERAIKNPINEDNVIEMGILPDSKYCVQRKDNSDASLFCYLTLNTEELDTKDIRLEINFKTSTEELDEHFKEKYTYTVPNTERSIERVFRY